MDYSLFLFIFLFIISMIIGKFFIKKIPSAILNVTVILMIFTISLWGGSGIGGRQIVYLLFLSLLTAPLLIAITYFLGFFLSAKGKSNWEKINLKSQFKYILPFIVGMSIGMLFRALPSNVIMSAINYELVALIVVSGIQIGEDLKLEAIKKAFGFAMFSVIADVAGAILTSIILTPFFPFKEILLVTLGSGWVTYTAPFIANTYGGVAGVFAFLVNFFRDEVAFVLLPLFFRARVSPIGAIAVGGTASMDAILPLYIELLGNEYAMSAVASGLVLSMLVPIILPLVALL